MSQENQNIEEEIPEENIEEIKNSEIQQANNTQKSSNQEQNSADLQEQISEKTQQDKKSLEKTEINQENQEQPDNIQQKTAEKEQNNNEDQIQEEIQEENNNNEDQDLEQQEAQAKDTQTKFFSKSEWIYQFKRGPKTQQPSKRWGHTAVVYNNMMYIFGGFCKSNQKQSKSQDNIIYRFDCDNNDWERIQIQDLNPSRRDSHAAAQQGQYMYIFGGSLSEDDEQDGILNNELWQFDFKCLKWKKIEQKGDIPKEREGAQLLTLNEQYMFLIGGHDLNISKIYNDYYLYDSYTQTWQEIKCVNNKDYQTREGITATLIKDSIYLFGGQLENNNQYFNDIYKIQITQIIKNKANQIYLKPVQTSTNLKPLCRSSHSACAYKDRFLIILGGETYNQEELNQKENENEIEQEKQKDDQNSSMEVKSGHFIKMESIFIFDTELKCWLEIKPTKSKGVGNPFPRVCFSVSVYQDQVIIFGGLINQEDKSDDLIKLKLQDKRDGSNYLDSNQLNSNKVELCRNCHLVLGLQDYLDPNQTNQQKNQSEQKNQLSVLPNLTQELKQQQIEKFQLEDTMKQQEEDFQKYLKDIDRKKLRKLGTPKMSIGFFSAIANLNQYPFYGFGLILDASKILKTKNLNFNLFISDRKLINSSQNETNHSKFLDTKITEQILKNENQKLYFSVFDDTPGFTEQQFYQVLYDVGNITDIDIEQEEDDLILEEDKWSNYATLIKLGIFSIGDTMLITSKDQNTGILKVGYISSQKQNNPDVNEMICFMFFYDTQGNYENDDDRFLSENGILHKKLILNNIKDYITEDQLLKQSEFGNYYYILNLKKIPRHQNFYDYQFSYCPIKHDLYIKYSGYEKYKRQQQINNLVDFSFKQYVTLLYLDQKPSSEISVFFNGKSLESKNYRKQLENLQKQNLLTQTDLYKKIPNIRECGNITLYYPTKYIDFEVQKQENLKKQSIDNQEIKEEETQQQQTENKEIIIEEDKNQQVQQDEKQKSQSEIKEENQEKIINEDQQQNNQNQNQVKKPETEQEDEDDDIIQIQVIESENEIQKQQLIKKQTYDQIEEIQQGILIYYRKRLICRAETEFLGHYFVNKVLRKSVKPNNLDQPFYLRFSGIVEVKEFLKPNIFKMGFENTFFSSTLYQSFKNLIRYTKKYDRQYIQEQLAQNLVDKKMKDLIAKEKQLEQENQNLNKQQNEKISELQKQNLAIQQEKDILQENYNKLLKDYEEIQKQNQEKQQQQQEVEEKQEEKIEENEENQIQEENNNSTINNKNNSNNQSSQKEDQQLNSSIQEEVKKSQSQDKQDEKNYSKIIESDAENSDQDQNNIINQQNINIEQNQSLIDQQSQQIQQALVIEDSEEDEEDIQNIQTSQKQQRSQSQDIKEEEEIEGSNPSKKVKPNQDLNNSQEKSQ